MKTGDKLGMQPPAGGCTTAQKKSRAARSARENVSFSEIVSVLQVTQVAGTGFEQINDLSGTSNICAEGSAKSSALSTEMHHLDPQLELLIERWPTLSKVVQKQIMLLVG